MRSADDGGGRGNGMFTMKIVKGEEFFDRIYWMGRAGFGQGFRAEWMFWVVIRVASFWCSRNGVTSLANFEQSRLLIA